MRPILHHHQAGALDQLGGSQSGRADRHNPVCVALNHQRGNVDTGQVLTEVLMPGGHAGETGGGGGRGCDVPARLHGLLADALAQQLIGIVEILEEFGEKGVAIRGDGFFYSIEDAGFDALRIIQQSSAERAGRRR